MAKQSVIKKNIENSIQLKKEIFEDLEFLKTFEDICSTVVDCYQRKGKVLFCGNGGSAADSQHLSAELSGRYYFDRSPLFSEALHVNTSYLTAVANDYSYEEVYARLIQAMGEKGDVLIGLSTSGNSKNVVNAFKKAKSIGMYTIAFTGKGGGEMKNHCDFLIEVQSTDTPRIQEIHMLVGHSLCEIVEQEMFPKNNNS